MNDRERARESITCSISIPRDRWYVKWVSQCYLLLWKNWRLAVRNKRATIVQLIAPSLFVLSLFVFQKSIESTNYYGDFYNVVKHQEAKVPSSIPLCIKGPQLPQCWYFTMVFEMMIKDSSIHSQ
eukprot:TRINITY_DN14517_c0_g1_i1.p1 TRINITY_DN14517_c0_g1~~TRINITY_DN14517_c0_g1_i1.p1  ORF type:complete len:125 (+),score=16.23 TRINITY_DN14517_c0_g1_i1:112-486(+)